MFEWLNQLTTSKLSPFIEKHGKNKIIKWSMIFCGAGALSAIGNGGIISFIFFLLATTYIFSTTKKGEKINALFKEKKLITKTENSEYWLAVILTLIAFIFYPNPPSVSQAEGLTQQEKKEIKNLSYDAKLHCHVAVKMRLGDLF